MENCMSVSTPTEPVLDLSKKDCPTKAEDIKDAEEVPYRHLIGSLTYLMISTKPDLAHAVGISEREFLSRFVSNPGKRH